MQCHQPGGAGALDGMYSVCTVDGVSGVFHLAVFTPMVEVDGRWEVVDESPGFEGQCSICGTQGCDEHEDGYDG